jgi:carbon monoxide dehydrogenase subunit G
MYGALLFGLALAGEPVERVSDDGTVTFTEVVPEDREALLRVLGDPKAVAAMSPDVKSLEVLAQGRCTTLRATVTSAFVPVTYTYERCPTATGFRDRLLESDVMRVYDIEWTLVPEGDGTRVTYSARIDATLAPKSYIVSKTRASMRALLARLLDRVP